MIIFDHHKNGCAANLFCSIESYWGHRPHLRASPMCLQVRGVYIMVSRFAFLWDFCVCARECAYTCVLIHFLCFLFVFFCLFCLSLDYLFLFYFTLSYCYYFRCLFVFWWEREKKGVDLGKSGDGETGRGKATECFIKNWFSVKKK